MKKAKDWFEEELSGEPLTQESVIECIKMVQEDVIRETAKECNIEFILYSKNLTTEYTINVENYTSFVSKEILSVVDKLIKEL